MDAEFRYQGGTFAGQVRVVRKEFATIGRHPSADIRFDSHRDLDVSGRHAAVFRQGDAWLVRDLGSTNGTWVNGNRIRGDHPLTPGDRIRFGPDGPELLFHPHTAELPTIPMTAVSGDGPRSAPGEERPKVVIPKPGTTEQIRREVHRQTSGWRRATYAFDAVGVVAVLGLGLVMVQRKRSREDLRQVLLTQADHLMERLSSATSDIGVLKTELETARRETEALRAEIADRSTGPRKLDSLSARLTREGVSRTAVLRAVRFDRTAVDSANGDAVAVLASELPGGTRISGSAFVVRVRGDTGWAITARHLVLDSAGRPAIRLGMIFNGSSQNFRAMLLGVNEEADLALVQVRVRGGVPAVRGVGAEPSTGDAVAILGFPLGLDPLGRWRTSGVQVVGWTGTVRLPAGERMEIDGYGMIGSSGSPVFNARGEVAGVVYGGDPQSSGRIVYAVGAAQLKKFLEQRLSR